MYIQAGLSALLLAVLLVAYLMMFNKWRRSVDLPKPFMWIRYGVGLLILLSWYFFSTSEPYMTMISRWVSIIVVAVLISLIVVNLKQPWRFAKPLTLRGGFFFLMKEVPYSAAMLLWLDVFSSTQISRGYFFFAVVIFAIAIGLAVLKSVFILAYKRSMLLRKVLGYPGVFIPTDFNRADIIYCSTFLEQNEFIFIDERADSEEYYYLSFDLIAKHTMQLEKFFHWHFETAGTRKIIRYDADLVLAVPISAKSKYSFFEEADGCNVCRYNL